MSAKAAIDKAAEMGVTDPERVSWWSQLRRVYDSESAGAFEPVSRRNSGGAVCQSHFDTLVFKVSGARFGKRLIYI